MTLTGCEVDPPFVSGKRIIRGVHPPARPRRQQNHICAGLFYGIVMRKKAFLFYFVLFLFILLVSGVVENFDYDLWARLIAGMGVIDGGQVLKSDFLSYTPVHTWWDHEWGSGVVFYFFLKYFGPYSLIILQAVMTFGIFFLVSQILRIREVKNPYNILFYIVAFMTVAVNINCPVRCHMFSFLLFTLFIYLLELVRYKNKDFLLYFIPIIVIFWNNVHGGVVSGLGLIFMYAVGEFLNRKPWLKYIWVLLVSSLVLLINPWGFDYIKFLIMANTMHRADIVEWWNIFSHYHLFRYIQFKIFMILVVTAELVLLFKQHKFEWYKNCDKVKYIILLVTLYLAISHVKLMPFFVITSLCFVYEDLYKLFENFNLPKWFDKVIYSLLIAVILFNFSTRDFSLPVGINKYPVKEVEFVKINNLKGKILVNFGYGSFVSYKLYPNNLIFMDGRYEEVYYDYMVPLLKEFFLVRPNWEQIFTYFPPDIMIIEKRYPIFQVLNKSKDWKLVYEGDVFGVFLPNDMSNKKFLLPNSDLKYYKNTLFDTDINFKK